MLKSAASKVMWVGRATVFLVGLAVILALVFGAASTALGANGDNFILGKISNTATRTTWLVADIANKAPAMRVQNNGAGPAINMRVGDAPPATNGVPPMKVNSQARIKNLNADLLDGNHASDFLGSNVTVVTEEDDMNDGDTRATNTALCDETDGAIATGGGAAIVTDGANEAKAPNNGGFVVAASRPALTNGADQPPTGWQASVFDFDGTASNNGLFTLRVYAVCSPVGGG